MGAIGGAQEDLRPPPEGGGAHHPPGRVSDPGLPPHQDHREHDLRWLPRGQERRLSGEEGRTKLSTAWLLSIGNNLCLLSHPKQNLLFPLIIFEFQLSVKMFVFYYLNQQIYYLEIILSI